VSNGFVAHRHTHFHHSGDVAQKFVIHSVFLCKAIKVIIAAARKKKAWEVGGMKIKSESKTLRPDALTPPSPRERVKTLKTVSTDGFAVYTAVWKITPSAFSVY
jgi:hypothetical protein